MHNVEKENVGQDCDYNLIFMDCNMPIMDLIRRNWRLFHIQSVNRRIEQTKEWNEKPSRKTINSDSTKRRKSIEVNYAFQHLARKERKWNKSA